MKLKPTLGLPTGLVAGLLCLASATALAATPASDATALYQQERAVCLSGQSPQHRSTCIHASLHGPLSSQHCTT